MTNPMYASAQRHWFSTTSTTLHTKKHIMMFTAFSRTHAVGKAHPGATGAKVHNEAGCQLEGADQ